MQQCAPARPVRPCVHRCRARRQGRYVVQVLEPNSPLRLEAQANQAQVLAGGNVQLQARLLEDGATTAQLASRRGGLGGEALLVAPDGRSWPQRLLRTTDGSLRAQVHPRRSRQRAGAVGTAGVRPGRWRAARRQGGFRGGTPTARFSGQAAPDVQPPGGTAAAGGRRWRYEARGTLYATARDGQLKPVAQAHAAAWFDGPAGQLVLPFDQAALPAGFGAPYELRDLQLQDQSRMAPIESRALALRF